MLTLEQASNLAQAELQKLAEKAGPKLTDLMILEDKVSERPSGWIFPYNTKRFAEGKQQLAAVVGTGPIFVDKNTGSVHILPSAGIEQWLATYEKTGAPPKKADAWKYIGKGAPPKFNPVNHNNIRIRKKR